MALLTKYPLDLTPKKKQREKIKS